VLAVDAGEGREAGVDAGMVDLFRGRIVLRHDDGAGATSSFAAAALVGECMLVARLR
jgi:hypothetical protein